MRTLLSVLLFSGALGILMAACPPDQARADPVAVPDAVNLWSPMPKGDAADRATPAMSSRGEETEDLDPARSLLLPGGRGLVTIEPGRVTGFVLRMINLWDSRGNLVWRVPLHQGDVYPAAWEPIHTIAYRPDLDHLIIANQACYWVLFRPTGKELGMYFWGPCQIPTLPRNFLQMPVDSATARFCVLIMLQSDGDPGIYAKFGRAIPLASPQQSPERVEIVKTWEGQVRMELRKEAPRCGFITNQGAWAKLWRAYRGSEPLPDIDLDTYLILVAVNNDPNRISMNFRVDPGGNLQVARQTTLRYYENPETGAYQFVLIKQDGIRTVDGQPVIPD